MECCNCHKEIKPEKGKMVKGNIYMVLDDEDGLRGGLIGSTNYEVLEFDQVPEKVFCNKCFLKLIEMEMEIPDLLIAITNCKARGNAEMRGATLMYDYIKKIIK